MSEDADAPDRIGRFHILNELGAGGFGIVYKAWDPSLERHVAVKVLHHTGSGDASFDMIRREARLTASLCHPGIVAIYEIGQAEGQLFFVMELVEGCDLRESLQPGAPLRVPLFDLAVQLADALHYAHEAGVVHRDLKPRNVRLSRTGTVRLLDFGCASLIRAKTAGSPKTFTGTIGYMAPEQIAGDDIDGRCDLFSLGVLLYEVACSRRPFVGESASTVLRRTLFDEPPPMLELVGTADAWLSPLILRCLEKRRTARFATAGELCQQLKALRPSTVLGEPPMAQVERVADPDADATTSDHVRGADPGAIRARPPARLLFRLRDELGGEPDAGDAHLVPRHGGDERALARLVARDGFDGLRTGSAATTRFIVDSEPTLDHLVAATFAQSLLAGQPLSPRAAVFAEYTALAREGLRPGDVPLEMSMEGVFQAIRRNAGDDLTDAGTRDRFLDKWQYLERAIQTAMDDDRDPFYDPFLRDVAELARERAFLARDRAVYRQDTRRGERWLARVADGPGRSSALYLDRPKSVMFKHWCRDDADAPTGDCYLLLVVRWGPGRWVCSTDPVQRVSLLPLYERLDALERAAASPASWFRGDPFGNTLIAAPSGGSSLPDELVLDAIKQALEATPGATSVDL